LFDPPEAAHVLCVINPYARTLRKSSTVKMRRKMCSASPMTKAFHVQHGSMGEVIARLTQLAKIVERISGSKNLDSTIAIALRRGC
jgi:hypothetical protein